MYNVYVKNIYWMKHEVSENSHQPELTSQSLTQHLLGWVSGLVTNPREKVFHVVCPNMK